MWKWIAALGGLGFGWLGGCMNDVDCGVPPAAVPEVTLSDRASEDPRWRYTAHVTATKVEVEHSDTDGRRWRATYRVGEVVEQW